ncbi:MAG: PAS domain S-box protein, partial [Candidatus Thorarchaeota archaeon]
MITIRTLLVDDFEDLLFIACKFLEKQAPDIELVTCESANEALKKLEEEDFDIIVSDYQMPVMDGLEFLETVRKSGNEIPFIIFTGRGREEVAIQALNLGATHYLKKGGEQRSQFAELAHHIRTAVSHRQSVIALHESEGRYRSLFDDAAVSLWDEDFSGVKKFFDEKRLEGVTDFRAHFEEHPEDVKKCVGLVIVTDVNNASIIGQGVTTKQDLVGPLEGVFSDDALDVFTDELISLAEGNTLFKSEVHLIKDVAGDEHAFIFQLNVPPGYENSLAKVYLSIIDVTERYQSELLAARESERAQSYLELSPVMFVALDVDGSIKFVNSHTCEILGYDEEELIGNDWFALAIPDTMNEEVMGAFNAIMEGRLEAVRYFENPIQTKDGEERIIAWNNTYLTDEFGTINGVLSSGEDITDRKLMDEALKNREGQLKSVFDESPISLGYYDSEGKMIDANTRYLELFGIESVEAFQGHRMRPHLLNYIKENLETQESFIWDLEYDFDAVVAAGYPMSRTGKIDIEIHSSRIPIIGHVEYGYLMQVIETTERKKTMVQLTSSEKRYRLVLGSMNDPIFVFDKDNCYREIYVSQSRPLIFSKEDMLGKHVSEIIPSHNIERYLGVLATVRETGTPQTFEYSSDRDGKEDWYISTLTLHEDGESVVSVSRKITDSVKAQQAISDSEERYRLVLNSLNDRIFVFDKNDCYSQIYVSDEQRHLIVPKENMLGTHVREIMPPHLLEPFLELLCKVRETSKPQTFEYSLIREGNEEWYISRLTLHEDGESVVSVSRKVTAKRKVEQSLRESEERYRLVLNSMNDLIFVYDKNDCYSQVYASDESLLRTPKENMLGKHVSEIVPPERLKSYLAIFDKIRETGVSQSFEYPIDYEESKKWLNATLILHEDGESIVSVARDITEKKLAEQSLKESEERYRL